MVRTMIALVPLVLLASGLTGCTIPIGKHNGEPIVEIDPVEILLSDDDDCPCHCDECRGHHRHH